jgi:hypothetical protein
MKQERVWYNFSFVEGINRSSVERRDALADWAGSEL